MKNIFFSHVKEGSPIARLSNISLEIHHGENWAIIGKSGSGKSTLLNLLGLLDQPTHGLMMFDDVDISKMGDDERATMRNRKIGFIFQNFNLLPRLSALDNVALPLLYRGISSQKARALAHEELKRVGLSDRSLYRPADLSGGQRQRVAIARALVGQPTLILADEPTGSLDDEAAREVIDLLLSLNIKKRTTLVLVTHDMEIAERFENRLCIDSGLIQDMHQYART